MEFKHHRWGCVQSSCLGWYGFRFGTCAQDWCLSSSLGQWSDVGFSTSQRIIHPPSFGQIQLPPKFQAQAGPQGTFQIVQPHSHPIPTLVPSLPLAWLSQCSSHSLFAGSQAAAASAITQNYEQMSRLLTWTVLNHYITLVLKITALAPHKILHLLLDLAPELLDLLTCSSLPKRAACAS